MTKNMQPIFLPRDCARPAHFSTDQSAENVKEECDYSLKIDLEQAKMGTCPRQVRIYADGVYDMFHSGHARQLMQIHTLIPNAYLIVGVTNDRITHERKGRSVMNERERYEAVRHCRYVDEVHKDAPWIISKEFIEQNKIDFVAHDAIPYSYNDGDDAYSLPKKLGMFLETQRTEGISTTDVIARIIRDYDTYLKRNLKRGVTRKELNISYYKEARLRLSENFESVSGKIRNAIDFLEGKSHQLAARFLGRFATDGRLLPSFLQIGFHSASNSANTSDANDLTDDDISFSDESVSEEYKRPRLNKNISNEFPDIDH